MHFGDTQQLRDAFGARVAVAADHHGAHAVGLQALDGVDRAVAQAIAEGHEAQQSRRIARDVRQPRHRAPERLQLDRACGQGLQVDAQLGHPARAAQAQFQVVPARLERALRRLRQPAAGRQSGALARAHDRAGGDGLGQAGFGVRARIVGRAHAGGHALARHRALRARAGYARVRAARHVQHRLRQRMRAAALHGGRQRQQARGIAVDGHAGHQHRLAFGERARLVERHHRDVVGDLQRLGVLDQDAVARGDAGAGHHRRRRGQPQRARAGDHQHGDGVEQRALPVAAGAAPGQQRDQRRDAHHRHEHRADAVDQVLDRRLLLLRRSDEPHDARQRGFGAHRRDADQQQALAVDRAAGDAIAGSARDGQALAGDQRLVDVALALLDLAVGGETFAGPHHQQVADAQLRDRDVRVAPVTAHPCGGRLQRLQRAQRLRRLPLGARLQPLAQQHQRDDDGGRFEVQVLRRHAGGHAARARAGPPVVQAQAVGRRGAERHQHVHVGAAAAQRTPGAGIEARAEPELHRRRQQELQPRGPAPRQAHHAAQHRQQQRGRQRRRDDHRPPGPGVRLRRRHGQIGCAGRITGLAHRRLQAFERQRRLGTHARQLRGHVDAGLGHARHGPQRTLHAAGAGGATHPLHRKGPIATGGQDGNGRQAGHRQELNRNKSTVSTVCL